MDFSLVRKFKLEIHEVLEKFGNDFRGHSFITDGEYQANENKIKM